MRNISVEALQGILEDVQRIRVEYQRARQSLVEYELVMERELIYQPFPPDMEKRISERIDAKQAQLDEWRKRQATW